MKKVQCSQCGTENESNSKYCQKCGEELKSNGITKVTDENQKTGIIGWWDKQGKNNKLLTGFGSCCLGIIVFVVLIAMLFPVTSLSVEPTQIQIDNQTTEYTIQGKAEPNATVKITAPLLDLNDTIVNVDNKGNFSYKVFIPINVTETDLNITAKSPNKSQTGEKINIQRPLTPLTINPVNFSSNATTIVIQGKTDPNASITLNSKDFNLTDVQLTADDQGNFNKSVTVTSDLNSTELEGKANATGKRSNTQKINITREPPAPTTETSNNDSSSSSTPTVNDTSSSSSTTSSNNPPSSSATGTFVGSINSDVYHYPSCASAKRIQSENLITFNSVSDAKRAGYRPCEKCNPPG